MSTTEEQIAGQMTPDEDELEAEADEQGDDGEQDGEQVAPEAAAPAPRSQKEIDDLTKKLEAEAARHEKRVAEIMGDDFALLVPSPVDWTPGFIFNVPEMHPTPEAVATLHALLGQSAPVELREADDAEGCDKCNALGEVLTGSRKPGQETKPCTACTGTGWRTKAQQLQAVPTPTIYTGTGTTLGNGPNQFPVADRWGRPYGHPHYNIEPANVGA